MARAFIMVNVEAGGAEALSEQLDGLEHVVTANVVAGDFDVIVEADASEVRDIIHSVATRIREFDDVRDTKTYVCLE
jgi:DNA-binding Lrp family transcriptional regulator